MASNNPSVRQFKTDLLEFVNRAKYDFHQETLAMADELVGNIQRAIEHSDSGHLSQSVRKQDVTNSDQTRISVLIRAGGALTTRRTADGAAFDYALAEEFGTTKETPRPFFYSTVRLYLHAGLDRYRETLQQAIDENNLTRRVLTENNYKDPTPAFGQSQTTISVSHRGAVAIQTNNQGRQET
jgi:hypothetical protein